MVSWVGEDNKVGGSNRGVDEMKRGCNGGIGGGKG